jgi:hypothetical protein
MDPNAARCFADESRSAQPPGGNLPEVTCLAAIWSASMTLFIFCPIIE